MNKQFFRFSISTAPKLLLFCAFLIFLLKINSYTLFAAGGGGNTPLPHWLEQKKVGDYTYQQEMKAERAEQLINQVIVPQTVVKNGKTITAAAGEVRILIGSDVINFKGVNTLGVFLIVGKEKLAGKWVFRLNDEYKEETQELSIILDAGNFVQSVQLKSRNYGEISFKLPLKSATRLQAEKLHYTSKSSLQIRSYNDLAGKKIFPQRKLQKINNDLRDDKVDIEEQLFFLFDSESISLNIGRQVLTLKVKSTNIVPASGQDNTSKRLVIHTHKQPAAVNIRLNAQNRIEAIEWENTQYILAP